MDDNKKAYYKNLGYTDDEITNAEIACEKYGVAINDFLANTKKSKRSADAKIATTSTTPTTNVISQPGSEIYKIRTSTLSLMTCIRADSARIAYCIVLHNCTDNTKHVNASNEPVQIINEVLFTTLLDLLNNATSMIKDTQRELEITTRERDLYKATIDALRKNGIID